MLPVHAGRTQATGNTQVLPTPVHCVALLQLVAPTLHVPRPQFESVVQKFVFPVQCPEQLALV